MSYPTFEEWWNVASGYFEEAAKNAWHARDAEIADLERQLAEAQSQVAVVDRALHDLGDTSAQAALDAYVQEKVDPYRKALESIATNTCCGPCREAALVAKKALNG